MAYTRIEGLQLQYTVEIRPVYQLLSGNLHKLASVAGVIRQAFNEQSPVSSLASWALASELMLLLLSRSLLGTSYVVQLVFHKATALELQLLVPPSTLA